MGAARDRLTPAPEKLRGVSGFVLGVLCSAAGSARRMLPPRDIDVACRIGARGLIPSSYPCLRAENRAADGLVAKQSEAQPRRHGGRPWPKGVSGNPSGSRVNTRAVVLVAEMATDFVEALSGVDRVMLHQAARLMARSARAKSADTP